MKADRKLIADVSGLLKSGDLPTYDATVAAAIRTCSKSFKQKGQEGQMYKLQARVKQTLTVLPKSSILLQPGKGALNDPALWHYLKETLNKPINRGE